MRECEFRGRTDGCGHVFCERGGFWTSCATPFCGGEPACAFVEPDNSSEARRARIEWLRGKAERKSIPSLAMNAQPYQMALDL